MWHKSLISFARTLLRTLLIGLLGLVIAACTAPTAVVPTTHTDIAAAEASVPIQLRIGYQRGGEFMLMKVQQTLEKRFGQDVAVTWTLFTSGPPLLEALNAGEIDLGSTGDTPPIFAQAAGVPLIYVASRTSNGAGSAIIVSADSPIQSITQLRGKKVAFTKASSAHLLLIRTLEKFGLTYSDIDPVFLQPPEARAALQSNSIDAWVIWNPFLESAKQELNAQVLVDGSEVSPTKGFVLASETFVAEHDAIVSAVIEELQAARRWAIANIEDYASLLEKETEVPASVWINSFQIDAPEYLFMDEVAVNYQQNVADIFYELELIPERLEITQVVWYGAED